MAITKKEKLDILLNSKDIKEQFKNLFKEEILNTEKEELGNHVNVQIPFSIDIKKTKK